MLTCEKCKQEVPEVELVIVFGLRREDITEEFEHNILDYYCAKCVGHGWVKFRRRSEPLVDITQVCGDIP